MGDRGRRDEIGVSEKHSGGGKGNDQSTRKGEKEGEVKGERQVSSAWQAAYVTRLVLPERR